MGLEFIGLQASAYRNPDPSKETSSFLMACVASYQRKGATFLAFRVYVHSECPTNLYITETPQIVCTIDLQDYPFGV